jgi:hypothetical protein
VKVKVFLLAGAAALAAVAMACGDDDDPESPETTSGGDAAQDGGAAGGGLTLPNTWIEYDGEKKQLTNILFEGVDVDAKEFTKVGRFDAIDIEGTTGEVFERAGDTDAVWTYTPPGDAEDEEPNGMWHRWATPPSGGEAAAS